MVDFQQLFRVRVAAERGPVGDHLRREIGADAGERLESGAVGLVQVDAGNVDVGFQAVEDRIGYYIRLCEVRWPAETAALGAIVQDRLGLSGRNPLRKQSAILLKNTETGYTRIPNAFAF